MGGEPDLLVYNGKCHFASTGNAVNFGDLTQGRGKRQQGQHPQIVFVFYFGGSSDSPSSGTIHDDCDVIIIQEQSNSVDFGDLHTTTQIMNGVISNGHGGL